MNENRENNEIPQMGTSTQDDRNSDRVSESSDREALKHDVMKKHEELIRLSEDGEISQLVQNLKKVSDKIILKIYNEYEIKQAEKANVFLTDLLISKFADLLGGLEAIESSEELEKELVKDKLLKRDVKSVVEKLSPYLPYLGILSGGVTVGKHVIKKQSKKDDIERSSHHPKGSAPKVQQRSCSGPSTSKTE